MTENDPSTTDTDRPEELEELLREAGRCLRDAFHLAEDREVEQMIKSGHGSVSAAVHELNKEDDSDA